MKKTFKTIFLVLICLAVVGLSALYISTLYIPVMEPSGEVGRKEWHLISTACHLMLIVLIPVYLMTWFIAWRYKDKGRGKHTPDWEHNYIAEYCWWGVPLIIVIILSALIWKSSHELNPFKSIEREEKKEVTIQAIALNWKWLFIYPEQGIATVNFVQFPDNTPINFEITADAPMNSFWIPALGGQIYAMPAMKSQLHLIADKPGKYKGLSANFSGKGFAGMTFIAQSSGDADFDSWMQKGKSSAGTLDIKEYERLALDSENEPVAFYTLGDPNLFQYVLDKYNVPGKKK